MSDEQIQLRFDEPAAADRPEAPDRSEAPDGSEALDPIDLPAAAPADVSDPLPPVDRPSGVADAASPVARALLYRADGALRRELPTADGGGAVFSARQAAAIERRGETLVSAGAGAGKTSVLVERYLRLLEGDDRLSTGTILAITFTEKAAAEMRERVRLRLSALLGGRADLPERWRLEDAWIGTFHGVAQRILRRFSFAAGIDPDVAIADEERAAELRLAAFEQAVAQWLRDPLAARGADFPAAPGKPDPDAGAERNDEDGVAGSTTARTDDTPTVDAEAALALAASVGIDALRDETLALLALRRTQGRDPADAPARGETALPVPAATDAAATIAAARALHAAAPLAAEEARERFDAGKPTPAGQRALDALHDVVADVGLGDPDVLPPLDRLQAWVLPDRRSKPMKGPAVEALRTARDRAITAAWAQRLGPYGVRDLRLREALLVATARTYRAAKRGQATLDFDDLLLGLLDLLRRNPGIAARLRGRFRQVLVDEYQDTNPVQLELVRLLSDPDGRFQVGDRLQAIYGFRHATVAGFDGAAERAEAVGGRLALNETFRCRVDVLAVANRVGAPSHEGFQPLVGGHDRPLGDARDAPPVEVHVLAAAADDGGPANGTDGPDPDEAGVVAGEPEHVAAVVAELIAAGRRASEIALLVRRKAPVAALERALLEHGIDTVPVVAAPLLETLEVRELEAWLRAVANPYDDVALLGALRLPSAGIDADALVPLLAEHRAARDERAGDERPSLWDTLQEYLDTDYRERYPVSEDARDDLFQQLTVLRKHRAHARTWGPAQVLARIRADDGYRASILSRPGGVRRWAGVDAFIDWVEEQEAAGDDLTTLLDRIARDRGGPEAPVLTDGDAVRITTVHRSKGLEWPVVICCDLGAPVRVVEPGLLVDPDPTRDRVGLRVPLPDGEKVGLWRYDELVAEGRRAQAEEERRLVHVAMTRAKERLILCGGWDPETEGTGEDKRPTGRLRADRVQPVEPGQGHDLQPRTAPLRWLLPLIAPPDVWPSCGGQVDVDVHDPSGATARPGRVRIVVCDPAATAPPASSPHEAAPALAIAPPRDDPEETSARPSFPLPDPVSYSRLSERLGVALGDDGWRDGLDDDGDGDDPDGGTPPVSDDAPMPALFTTAALDGRIRGVVVHRLLERRLLDPTAPPPGADLVRTLVADEPSAPEIDDADADALIAIAAALEASSPARDALGREADARHVERPFLLDLDPDPDPDVGLPPASGVALPLIHGVIDLWVDDGDAVTVVDWKTNALGGGSPDAAVARHYGLQRDVYALAALLGGARLVQVIFVFSEAPGRPVTFAFTQADRDTLRQHVAAEVARAQATPPR